MQVSHHSRQRLRALLNSPNWPHRCARVLARWREIAEQLFADGVRQFDEHQLRELVYAELGGRDQLNGRLQDEVELRIRFASAIFDFTQRAAHLKERASRQRDDAPAPSRQSLELGVPRQWGRPYRSHRLPR